MPYYYYVSDSVTVTGSATGDQGRSALDTPRTGAWSTTASESYVSIEAAFGATTPPAAGDFIYCSSDHDHDYSAAVSYTAVSVAAFTGVPVSILSMDVTAQDEYLAGASEDMASAAGGDDYTATGGIVLKGISITPADNLVLGGLQGWLEDCTISLITTNNNILCNSSSSYIIFKNTTISASAANTLNIDSGCFVELHNCVLSGAGWTVGLVGASQLDSGGGVYKIYDTDLSGFGSGDYLFESVGGSAADDKAEFVISRCKLNSALAGYMDESWEQPGQSLLITNSAGTSAEAEYQYHYSTFTGSVDDSTAIYRNESTAYAQASQKTSLLMDTSTIARAQPTAPFSFDLPSRPVDLTAAATDKLTVYLTTDTALTDTDVWLEVVYPDAVSHHDYTTVSTRAAGDIFAAGTALTTDTGSTWAGTAKTYKYRIEVTIADGEYCVPIIRAHVAVQALIWWDSQTDVS